jgi:hypothetical protein
VYAAFPDVPRPSSLRKKLPTAMILIFTASQISPKPHTDGNTMMPRTNLNPDVVIDGKMSEAENNLKIHFDHNWLCHIGRQGTYCHRIIFPPEWSSITKEVFYVDNAELNDPPESEPGLSAIGYHFLNFIFVIVIYRVIYEKRGML